MYNNYKQILEAVNRGIKFALSDLEDDEELSSIGSQKQSQIEDAKYSTKDLLDLKKEVVDLGLPSGTLWCKYNLGATCEPNNNNSWFGDYYSWGELEPNKKLFDWDHYKFYDGPDTKAVKDVVIEATPYYYLDTSWNEDELKIDANCCLAVNSSNYIRLSSLTNEGKTEVNTTACRYHLAEPQNQIKIKAGGERSFIKKITLYY